MNIQQKMQEQDMQPISDHTVSCGVAHGAIRAFVSRHNRLVVFTGGVMHSVASVAATLFGESTTISDMVTGVKEEFGINKHDFDTRGTGWSASNREDRNVVVAKNESKPLKPVCIGAARIIWHRHAHWYAATA